MTVAYPFAPMKIAEILARGPSYSFEFFPPAHAGGRDRAHRRARGARARSARPTSRSPTAPAGSTREKTHEIVTGILRDTPDDADGAPHLRRPHPGRARGDRRALPASPGSRTSSPSAAIRRPDSDLPAGRAASTRSSWCTSCAASATSRSASPRTRSRIRGRPTARPTGATPRRSSTPADFAITQFFFDAEHYFDLVESLRAHGIDKPVIAGIMPATTIGSIKRMSQLQGSEFPRWLADKLEAVADDPDAVFARRRRGSDEARARR